MLTFAEYAHEHYLPHAKQHKKSWQEDVWKIDRALIPAFGKKRLDELSSRDISIFHTSEKERKSGVTANHMIRLLGRMLRLAKEWEFIKVIFETKKAEPFLAPLWMLSVEIFYSVSDNFTLFPFSSVEGQSCQSTTEKEYG
jgi:hypothetical protein